MPDTEPRHTIAAVITVRRDAIQPSECQYTATVVLPGGSIYVSEGSSWLDVLRTAIARGERVVAK